VPAKQKSGVVGLSLCGPVSPRSVIPGSRQQGRLQVAESKALAAEEDLESADDLGMLRTWAKRGQPPHLRRGPHAFNLFGVVADLLLRVRSPHLRHEGGRASPEAAVQLGFSDVTHRMVTISLKGRPSSLWVLEFGTE
jgi:hypothetical protein